MSADNYAICPRCLDEARRVVGVIYVDEKDYCTFREDYEFYGAATGNVIAHYRGECDKCHLRLQFDDQHRFYSRETPGV